MNDLTRSDSIRFLAQTARLGYRRPLTPNTGSSQVSVQSCFVAAGVRAALVLAGR